MKTVLTLLVLLIPSLALAGEIDKSQIEKLSDLSKQSQFLNQCVEQGRLDAVQTRPLQDRLQGEMQTIVEGEIGHPAPYTTDEINRFLFKDRSLARFLTFKNVMVFLAGLFLVIAVAGIAVTWLGPVLKSVPYLAWEAIAWSLCILGLFSHHLWPWTDFWMVFPGALALIPCFSLSISLHFHSEKNWSKFLQFLSVTCFFVWGYFAIFYQSYFLGFITVMALEAFLGFSVFVLPLCYGIGFRDEDVIPRTMSASFVILCAYVVTSITGESFGQMDVFKPGMLWMGAFVYYLGCLIVSSRYYNWSSRKPINLHFVLMQVMTITSGLAAFYLGNQFGITPLLGIGGTFFALYLIEKYFEIPWEGGGWYVALLGFAIGLYYFAGYVTAHPEYFIPK